MEQSSQGAQNFQNTNGMSIEEAFQHVKIWYAEGKYDEVIDGCEEILRYVPDDAEVKKVLANAKIQMRQSAPQPEAIVTPVQQNIHAEPTQQMQKPELPAKSEEYKGGIAQDEKIISAIGYIGFLCVLPLLLKKDSKYCEFHGKQALILAIVFFLYKYLGIFRDLPGIGGLIQFMLGIVMIVELVVILMAMTQAFRGKKWKIPVIYGMSEKLKF